MDKRGTYTLDAIMFLVGIGMLFLGIGAKSWGLGIGGVFLTILAIILFLIKHG